MHSITQKLKYPRTPHLPDSAGVTEDDIIIDTSSVFQNIDVVVTEKMDGENTTLAKDYYHARSLDTSDHPSRSWIKNYWASIRYDIPDGFRICGENLYARHSIPYTNLPSFFLGFSLWEGPICLSWDETLQYFHLLDVEPVPVLWKGPGKNIPKIIIDEKTSEGYVIRNSDRFHYTNFAQNVAKYVRKNHVQTDEHWLSKPVIPNELR